MQRLSAAADGKDGGPGVGVGDHSSSFKGGGSMSKASGGSSANGASASASASASGGVSSASGAKNDATRPDIAGR